MTDQATRWCRACEAGTHTCGLATRPDAADVIARAVHRVDCGGDCDLVHTDDATGFYQSVADAAATDLRAAGMLLPEDTRTETTQWAAELTRYDGLDKHMPADDLDHARLIADSVNAHLETLNEPTRKEGGVERAQVVTRSVRHFADGSSWVGSWVPVPEEKP